MGGGGGLLERGVVYRGEFIGEGDCFRKGVGLLNFGPTGGGLIERQAV